MVDAETTRRYVRTLAYAKRQSARERWHEAATLWEEVVASNPVEGRFWLELAETCYQIENYRRAIVAYEKAIELGSGFPAESAYRIACCYGRLTERDSALDWLSTAFDMGFRHLEKAQTDKDLEPLHDDPRFREIVALIDPSKMSRKVGWQCDIALLSREVKRKAYNPFRYTSENEFDNAVQALTDSVSELTDAQILVEMQKFVAMLGDGHAGVYPSQDDHRDLCQTLPVWFYLFEEGLFVIATASEHTELLGSRILRFGDSSVEEVTQALDPLISRDNEHWLLKAIPYKLRELPILHALGMVSDPGNVQLTFVNQAGDTQVANIAATSEHFELSQMFPYPSEWSFLPDTLAEPPPLYLKNMDASYWFEYLPDDRLVYFQFNRVRDDPSESLADFCKRLFRFIEDHDVEKLAIDIRWNHGGNTFLEMPLVHRLIGCEKVNQSGKLFVIVGRRTFSAAQNFASFIERHTEAIFVGEPTGSSPNFVGETIPVQLPYSKLWMNVSDLYWQGSWPTDYRTWIAPQIYAPPTFAAFQANRDSPLEAILACCEHLPGW